MKIMNISLTPEQAQMVQSKLDSGAYRDAGDVIDEALRRLDASAEMLYELKLARLREVLAPGLREADAGEFAEYSLEGLMAELGKENPLA